MVDVSQLKFATCLRLGLRLATDCDLRCSPGQHELASGCKSTQVCNSVRTYDGRPNRFASRLTSSRKLQKALITWDQLASTCVGWPKWEKVAHEFALDQSQRKSAQVAKRNASWTQVQNCVDLRVRLPRTYKCGLSFWGKWGPFGLDYLAESTTNFGFCWGFSLGWGLGIEVWFTALKASFHYFHNTIMEMIKTRLECCKPAVELTQSLSHHQNPDWFVRQSSCP